MKIQFAGSSTSKQGAAGGGLCLDVAHAGFRDARLMFSDKIFFVC